MNTTGTAYCRLCAANKPLNELSNLQNNAEMWQKIVDKLTKFNIFIDQDENILPRTVCFLCSKSLESAFDFVTTVEQAQATLSDFNVVLVKKEDNDSADVNIFDNLPDGSMDIIDEIAEECDVKSEHSHNNMDMEGLSNDSDLKFYKPLKDKNCIDLKVMTKKLDIEIERKHETHSDTLQEFKKDKTSNAPLNINIDLNKSPKVDTGTTLKSEPEVIIRNTEYSIEYIVEHMNRLASLPLDAIKKTWTDVKWKCSFCETIFPNVEELQAHSMQIHNACNTYQCSDCNGKKLNLNGFIKHVREHRKYLHYSCYKCFMKFQSPNEGRIHKSVHKTSDYICLGCNTTFPTKDELETHEKAFYKNKWGKKSIETLNVSSKHTRKREHFCEICGMGFYAKTGLSNHMIVHSDKKPYQCEICKHKFKNIYSLRYHSKVHSGEKPFKCDQCGQCFREKRCLRNHIETHSIQESHNCTQCDKKFRRKSYLKNHMRQHTGEKPYSCEICERNFTGWSNYNKHMKRKHRMDKSKTKRTPLGPHAVDPTTGDVIYPAVDKVIEWKKKMKEPLNQKPRGRVSGKISFKESLKNMIMNYTDDC